MNYYNFAHIDIVPYNIALMLKELGFDEQCFFNYRKVTVTDYKTGDSSEPIIYLDKMNFTMNYNESNNEHDASAPMFSQAFRFFREKYGVHMFPEKFDEKTWWVEWGYWNSSIFDTYEEAELECLIKMIEIIKNETK